MTSSMPRGLVGAGAHRDRAERRDVCRGRPATTRDWALEGPVVAILSGGNVSLADLAALVR